jgi:hypothetical protein
MDIIAAPEMSTDEDILRPIHLPTVIPKPDHGDDSEHPLILSRQLTLAADHSVWIILSALRGCVDQNVLPCRHNHVALLIWKLPESSLIVYNRSFELS